MSIATFALADSSLAQSAVKDSGRKSPPKRTATAIADERTVPEPR